MVARGTPTPKKLRYDAIVEALFEIRFDAVSLIPEVLFGRLSEYGPWKGFTQRKLAAYEMPPSIRESDSTLRYSPVFELLGTARAIRIGPHVLSYHVAPPYPGWQVLNTELDLAIDGLFDKAPGIKATRLGLRYTNALNPAQHLISSVADLDLGISISNDRLTDGLNLNFTTAALVPDTRSTVRIATVDFLQGVIPPDTSVIVDVDVFTIDPYEADNSERVKRWVSDAHGIEKDEFFHLLKAETITALEEH